MIPEIVNYDEEEYWIRKTRITIEDETIELDLHFTSFSEDLESWYNLKLFGVHEYDFSSIPDGELFELTREHPLMLAHCDPKCALYCQVNEENAHVVLSVLLKTHRQFAQDWLDPFNYINHCAVDGWTFGQIASGPKFLMTEYYKAIKDISINCNILGGGYQKNTNVIGICFGNSYVIAEKYKLVKQIKPQTQKTSYLKEFIRRLRFS